MVSTVRKHFTNKSNSTVLAKFKPMSKITILFPGLPTFITNTKLFVSN